MRKTPIAVLALVLFLSPAVRADKDDAARDVIAKAVKAHGGEAKLLKQKVMRQKFKAKLEIMGMTIDMTGTNQQQLPDQYRADMQLDFNGNAISVLQVFNKGKGWLKVMDKSVPLENEQLDALKQAVYELEIRMLVPLLTDEKFSLGYIGEEKINGKPTLGVKVSAKDQKDIDLYFDKETGLLVKRVGRGLDQTTKQEVTQELFFSDYKENDGYKYPAKALMMSDSKKFMEIEVTEIQFLDKLDDSDFAQP